MFVDQVCHSQHPFWVVLLSAEQSVLECSPGAIVHSCCVGQESGDITGFNVDELKGSQDGTMWGHEVTTESPEALKLNIEHKNCIAETQYKSAHPTCLHQHLPPRQHLYVQANCLLNVCVCVFKQACSVWMPGYLWVNAHSISNICDLEVAGCTCQIEMWGCSVIFM